MPSQKTHKSADPRENDPSPVGHSQQLRPPKRGARPPLWQLGLSLSILIGACTGDVSGSPASHPNESGYQGASPGPEGVAGDPNTQGSKGGAGDDAGVTDPSSPGPSGNAGADPDEDLPAAGTPLPERLKVRDLTVSSGVKAGVSSWRIWGTSSLFVAPVYTAPLENCGTLVCFTSESAGEPTARVVYLDAQDALVESFVVGQARECRGLAAEPDGHFAVLTWSDASDAIAVRRFDLAGNMDWERPLTNSDNKPTDFGIGDSRLEYGAGTYGAYYHVHSDSGHEGDTLKWVKAADGTATTGWGWGCSHSMSNLLRFHPEHDTFMPACVTDCYPGTDGSFQTNSIGGIYLDHDRSHVLDVAGGCNGSVAGELGSAALASDGFRLTFNAHQAPASLGQSSYDPRSMNQDIGFVRVGPKLAAGDVVWLTSTADVNEADSSIARFAPSDDDTEQYLVGYSDGGAKYYLARVDAAGSFLEAAVEVSAQARWGRRDDPFRQHENGDVIWAWFDQPGSTRLHLGRVASGKKAACAAF